VQYDHEVVYMQNSIVNVDAVEKIYIKAAQGDSELNAKLINVVHVALAMGAAP
jgi:hypothetical protein